MSTQQTKKDEAELAEINVEILLVLAKQDISHLLAVSEVVAELVRRLKILKDEFDIIELQNKKEQNGSQTTS